MSISSTVRAAVQMFKKGGSRLLGQQSASDKLTNRLLALSPAAATSVVLEVVKSLPPQHQIRLKETTEVVQRLDYDRLDVWLRTQCTWEQWRQRVSCQREPWTVAWLEETFGKGDVLYDIGANVGVYSVLAGLISKRQGWLVAIEPAASNFDALCRNLQLNDLDHVAIALAVALGESTEITALNLRSRDAGAAGHGVGGEAPVPLASSKTARTCIQQILMLRLDDLVSTFGLPLPTHIKIDVDGGEVQVLQGAPTVLSNETVRSVMIEIEDDVREPVSDLLRTAGLAHAEHFEVLDNQGRIAEYSYDLFTRT